MMRTISKGYAAILLVVGTSRFFLFADFVFFYDVLIGPHFHGRKIPHPPREIIAIVGILAVSSLHAPHPLDGLQTAFRIYVLAMILPTYFYGFDFKRLLGISLSILALVVIAQIPFMARPNGLHMNALLLGEAALAFAPVFWLEVGLAVAIIITVSGSRSPMFALLIFAAIDRKKYAVRLALVATGMFLIFTAISFPDRLSIDGLVRDSEIRIDTVRGFDVLPPGYESQICGELRPLEYTPWGYGFGGYCDSTGQPRPHNIYVLSFYELGSLFLPFWFLIIYAGRRLSWWRLAPLLLLGGATDDIFGRPEGVYLVAAWIIGTHFMQTRRTPIE